jgi:hypothetical protein
MAAFITPPGLKRRFWSLLASLTLSKEFTLNAMVRSGTKWQAKTA